MASIDTSKSQPYPDVVLNLFRLLADANPQAILVLDRQGRIALTNSATETLFGYSSEQLTGREADLLVPGLFGNTPPDERERLFLEEADRLKCAQEFEGQNRQGERFPALVGLNPVKTEKGFFVFCSVCDVSDRKQVEAALEDSEAIYKSLVENLPINIIRKSREGRLVFVNRQYCETMNRAEADLLGKNDFELFPPALAEKYHQDDLRVMETGEVFEDVEEHQRPTGRPSMSIF